MTMVSQLSVTSDNPNNPLYICVYRSVRTGPEGGLTRPRHIMFVLASMSENTYMCVMSMLNDEDQNAAMITNFDAWNCPTNTYGSCWYMYWACFSLAWQSGDSSGCFLPRVRRRERFGTEGQPDTSQDTACALFTRAAESS